MITKITRLTKCMYCIHSLIQAGETSKENYVYCNLHNFGSVKSDFFCADFEIDYKTKIRNLNDLKPGNPFRYIHRSNDSHIYWRGEKIYDSKLEKYVILVYEYREHFNRRKCANYEDMYVQVIPANDIKKDD